MSMHTSVIHLLKSRLLLGMLVVSIGLACGVVISTITGANGGLWPGSKITGYADSGAAVSPPAPTSVNDLLNRGDAVLIGRITGGGETRYEGAFDPSSGRFAEPQTEPNAPNPGLPHTYYTVKPEEILLDDGIAARQSEVMLRLGGEPGTALHPKEGVRFLMVLGRNPDDLSYGIRGSWAVLDLEGQTVRDIAGRDLTFEAPREIDGFLAAVRKAVRDRQP